MCTLKTLPLEKYFTVEVSAGSFFLPFFQIKIHFPYSIGKRCTVQWWSRERKKGDDRVALNNIITLQRTHPNVMKQNTP
jgi:hypothetical protein